MTLNNKNSKNKLVAVSANHGMKDFGDFKKENQIFQSEMNTYNIILSKKIKLNDLYRALVDFFEANKKEFDLDFDSFTKITENEFNLDLLSCVMNAVEISTQYSYNLKSDKANLAKVNILMNDKKMEPIFNEFKNVVEARTIARRLQDTPSNIMVPGEFVEEIKTIFKDLKNIKINVLTRKELEKKGMNLLVGVGQAAKEDKDQPRLLTIEFMNDDSNKKDITAYVGKGVCFDTGGLNIKTANHMRWMKYDMSGAAIAAMTLYSLAKNNITGNFVAVCPLVINLCDTYGQRPDDVIKSYSGKTVEIDNTDAEGRLILADAITYAVRDLKVSRIFDIATLTGAMIYGLGDTYTGVWATSDELWNLTKISADKSAELVWRMPFHNDFIKMLDSSVADIANSVSDPRGGSSRAACFLREFTEDVPYVHFDIAATASRKNLGTGIILNTFYNMGKLIYEKK